MFVVFRACFRLLFVPDFETKTDAWRFQNSVFIWKLLQSIIVRKKTFLRDSRVDLLCLFDALDAAFLIFNALETGFKIDEF